MLAQAAGSSPPYAGADEFMPKKGQVRNE